MFSFQEHAFEGRIRELQEKSDLENAYIGILISSFGAGHQVVKEAQEDFAVMVCL